MNHAPATLHNDFSTRPISAMTGLKNSAAGPVKIRASSELRISTVGSSRDGRRRSCPLAFSTRTVLHSALSERERTVAYCWGHISRNLRGSVLGGRLGIGSTRGRSYKPPSLCRHPARILPRAVHRDHLPVTIAGGKAAISSKVARHRVRILPSPIGSLHRTTPARNPARGPFRHTG